MAEKNLRLIYTALFVYMRAYVLSTLTLTSTYLYVDNGWWEGHEKGGRVGRSSSRCVRGPLGFGGI